MTDDNETIAASAPKTAREPAQVMTRVLLAALMAALGGGGTWAYTSEAGAVHESKQNIQIAANKKSAQRNSQTIKKIAVLLVQQGRHVEGMVRAAAGGQDMPGRPPELDSIESAILSEPLD